jgi:transcriptional regulator with XRE-family HTH domain
MAGSDNPDVQTDRAAFQALRSATDEGARIVRGAAAPDWFFMAPNNGRTYLVRAVPYEVFETPPSEHQLSRLTVCDFSDPPTAEMPRWWAVLELSAFRGERLETRLRTGVVPGAKDGNVAAGGAGFVQFWIDYYNNRLGASLAGRLTPDQHSRMAELCERAGVAAGITVRARRGILKLTQSELADASGIPVEHVAATEAGKITIASPVVVEAALRLGEAHVGVLEPGGLDDVIESLLEAELAAAATGTNHGSAQLRTSHVAGVVTSRLSGTLLPDIAEPPENSKVRPYRNLHDGAPARELRERMARLGVSRAAVARESGVSASHIGNMHEGLRGISDDMRKRLDVALTRLEVKANSLS